MFDISLAEIGVVGVVGVLILGPKEFKNVVIYAKYCFVKMRNSISKYISPITEELNSIQEHIVDLEGKVQPTYNLSELKQKLAHGKKRKINKKNI